MSNFLVKLSCCGPREKDELEELFEVVNEVPLEILDATRIYEEKPPEETIHSPEQNGIPVKQLLAKKGNETLEEPIYKTVKPTEQNEIPEEPIYKTVKPTEQNETPEEPIYDTVNFPRQIETVVQPIYDRVSRRRLFTIPEEPEDDSGYTEMRRLHKTPLYLSLENVKKEDEKSLRFSITVEHSSPSNKENLTILDIFVPNDLLPNSHYKNCLFHVSVYNSVKERIVDLTVIGGLSSNFMMEHVAYWKDPQDNSWRLNVSSQDFFRALQQCHILPVTNVRVRASIVYTNINLKYSKSAELSRNPDAIPTSAGSTPSAGYAIHMTAYNLNLDKTLDMVFAHENNPHSESESHNQFRNLTAGSPGMNCNMPTFWIRL